MADQNEGRGLGGAGLVGAAGIGILAILGGIGKFLARSGDDVARVVVNSGDDVGRAFTHSGDDLARGAFGQGEHLSSGGNFGRVGGAFDDVARGNGQAIDDLPHSFSRSGSSSLLGPHREGWNFVDDVAAQEERLGETLGRLSDPAETARARPGGALGSGAAPAAGSQNSSSAALAELLQRTQRSRNQLADQMEAMQRLAQGTRAVEPQAVMQLAARQHERSLQVLTEVHKVADEAPLARLEEAARAPAAARAADSWSAPLASESRELAGHHGSGFLKHLLRAGERLYTPEGERQDRETPPTATLPALLAAAEADPNLELTSAQLQELRQELGRILSPKDAELGELERMLPAVQRAWASSPAAPADEQLLFDAAAQATALRLELFYAAKATERFAEQLRREFESPSADNPTTKP
jgi:hypothetical protein